MLRLRAGRRDKAVTKRGFPVRSRANRKTYFSLGKAHHGARRGQGGAGACAANELGQRRPVTRRSDLPAARRDRGSPRDRAARRLSQTAPANQPPRPAPASQSAPPRLPSVGHPRGAALLPPGRGRPGGGEREGFSSPLTPESEAARRSLPRSLGGG